MEWSYHGPARLGLLILFTIFFTDARECKINCHGSTGNLLRFEPGKVYNYKLEGHSVTTVVGASGEASKLGITADVQVSVLSSCEHALKVTNVQTSGQDSKKHSLSKLSQQPIKFGLQNGHIESELCANDAEDSVGLNIKRAVLSLIQSSVLKETGYGTQSETDVFGTCPTGFEFSKSGSILTIVKTRDLNKCAHREDITIPFLSTPYYLKSDMQTSPLLGSSLKSEQKIEGGTLKSATLEETYQYRPGSSPEATSKVSIKTHLSFVSSAPGAIPAACTVPRSIIFEQEHAQEGQGMSNKIVELVKQGCDSRVIAQDTAQKFSQLVRTVAAASKADINTALQHIKSGPGIKDRTTAQRMMLDAIVMAQSGSSVEVMAEILKKKEVTGNTARMWLLGLGAVKHASRSSLLAVLPLLDGEPDVNAYLGIGSLAGKYCREHACDGINEVNQLQIKLGAPLLKGCKVGSKKEEDQLIASLKGLGNIKYLGPKIAGKIAECAEDEHVRSRVRVAALETIATDANKEQFKTLALNILKNVEEDSEVRIKAYLVLAKCPCGKVAAAVKDLLNTEGSNQVGGYIVSHLRNLHASTNPDKAAARHHLGSIIPPHRFIIDPRRYSINHELSYSNGIINSGASGEADLIYSQNSYVPRSVSLNLTSQIFGTAYNFLEVDVRAENVERIAEHIFGPRGYLHTNKVEDILFDGKDHFNEVLEKIAARYDKTLRPKRSISRDQLNSIAQKVHLPSSSDDIDVDISLKVLGSEVAWSHLHGSDVKKVNKDQVIDDYFGSIDSVIQALKNSDVDYRRHLTFLDREVTYPTGMGLAFRLRTLGTAALRVKLDGKIDIPAIIRDPKNTNVRFQLIPSAAINLGGEIVIDGVAIETGVRIDLNIHSSTGSDVTLRVLDGHGVDVKLGLPLPKQELISVKTQFNSITRDDNHGLSTAPIKYETPRETYSGCFDQLNAVVGLTFCGEISGPYEQGKPLIPLYGPVSISVSIDKEDESLSAYHFKAYYAKNEENVHGLELLVDTPNSKSSRKLRFNFEGSVNDPKKFMSLDVESPWTTASLNAQVVKTNQEHSINVKFIQDGQEYSARLGAKTTDVGSSKVKYEPILEYKAPEPTKPALIGKKGGAKSKSQSISTAGSVLVEKSADKIRYVFQGLCIETPRTKYSVDGTVTIDKTSVDGDLKVSYEKEHIGIKGNSHHRPGDFAAHLEVAPTQYPDLGISATVELKKDTGKMDHKLILVHGPDPKSQVTRIYIHTHFEKAPGVIIKTHLGELNEFNFKHEITYPVAQLDFGIKAAASKNELSGGIKGKLDKYSAKLEGALHGGGKAGGDYQASLDSEFMGQELKLQSSRSVEGADKSRFTNLLIIKPGGSYQLNALVNHRFINSNDIDFSIEADGSIPNKAAIKLVGAWKRTASQCNSKIKFNLGDKCFIDGSLSVNKGNTPSAVFKLSLPGYLESDGKFTSDGLHSNLVSQLHLPKSDRRMEAKGEFTTKAPKYSGFISVCYDTKDPKKTFKLQTDTNLALAEKDWSIDTKNTLSHGDTVAQVNGKGVAKGVPLNSFADGEVEVVLPTGYHFGGKYHEKFNYDGLDGEVEVELWDKPRGEEGQKLDLKVLGKHIDFRAKTIDGQATLSYTTPSKKTIQGHIGAKKLPSSNGKSSNVALQIGEEGTLIDFPVSIKFESDVSNEYFDIDESLSIEDDLPPLSFKGSGTFGKDIKIESTGKVGKPSTLEIVGTLPETSPVKNFKYSSSYLIDIGDNDSKENGKVKFVESLHWNGNKHVKVLLEGQREENGGQYVAEFESDTISKRRLSGSAHFKAEDNIKGDASISLTFDDKNADLSVKGEINKERTDNTLHFLVNAPMVVDGGAVDVVVKNKVLKEGRGLTSDVTISQGGEKKITANGKVELDRDHPVVEVNLDRPSGKSRFLYKYDKKGDKHYTSELKVKWTGQGGGSITADHEFKLDSIDNFLIKGTVDAPQILEPSKVHVEIANKPAKGEAKKITFVVKGDDKVIASGTSNYNFKEEGDLAVLEGNGNIKYKDQSYPLNFQATRQLLEDGRVGKLSVKAGKMTLNVENKITPDEFSIERTFCKEPKSCSKAQISSKLKTGIDSDEQSTIVRLDMSLFNPKLHDISYKSEYKRQNIVADHNMELQWGSEGKLSSHAFVHDTSAGFFINFPKRTIGGEVKYDARKKDNSASFRVEGDLYLNKGKEPKICLIAGTTTVYDKGTATIAGETKFTHPGLQKDLVAKGQFSISDKPSKLIEGLLEVDVSPDVNNKLIGKLKISGAKDNVHTFATLKCKGCNIDITYEEKIKAVLNGKESTYLHSESISYTDSKNAKRELLAKFEASPKRIHGVVKSPEALIEAEFRTEKGYSGSLNIFGKKYHDSLTYNKEANTFTYHFTGFADGKALTVEAGGKIGGAGVLKASLGDKKACSVDVALDEVNFLKSKYAYDTDVLKNIYTVITNEANILARDGSKSLSAMYDKLSAEAKRSVECLGKVGPNEKSIGEFRSYYEKQIQEVRDELQNDPTLKEGIDTLKEVSGKFGEQVVAIIKEFVKLVETFSQLAKETRDTFVSIVKEIEPKLKVSCQRVSKAFNDLFEQYLKLSVQLVDLALDEIKKHQGDIEALGKTFVEFLEDVGKQIGQFVVTVNSQIDDLIKHNVDAIKELPIISAIEEKWVEMKDLQFPEEVFNLLHEIIESLKQLLPTNEATQFVTTLESVLNKVLKHEEIKNKDEVLKQLYKEFVAAIKSVIALLAQNAPKAALMKPTKVQPFPFLNYFRLPTGSLKVSLFNLLSSKEFLPSVTEILSGIKISLNPLNNVPPYEGQAFVIGGSEIITFDGVHLAIPAACSYVLSEDYKDRNFSIVGQISNGAFKSITVSSKEDSIEIRPSSNVLVNGKEHSFPAAAGELIAWRKPSSIGVWSKSGVLIMCLESLSSCSFQVNGFYFGRVRGLLGNLNGEKYDERLLPNGKIAPETGDLANAWKLDGSCSIPSTAEHKHTRISECTKLFTDEPMSLYCRLFVNPAPFRDACDHLAARSKGEGPCLAAQAYTAACREQGVLFAEVPDSCATCKINGKAVGAGESVTTTQGSSADIVLLVDQSKDNEANYKQIAIPLINDLKSELAKAGVSDTKIMTIGASPLHEYPSFLTNNKGEVLCDPASTNIWFDERPEVHNETLIDRLKNVYTFVNSELGHTSNRRMYETVSESPFVFRPNSYRIVIAVHERHCKPTLGTLASVIKRLVESELYAVHYSVISPVKTSIGKVEKDGKDVNAAVLSEHDAILSGGEKVEGTEYNGLDICVIGALENNGFVLSSDELKGSPQRTKLIGEAASKIVKQVTAEKKNLDCECALYKGFIAHPECSTLDAWHLKMETAECSLGPIKVEESLNIVSDGVSSPIKIEYDVPLERDDDLTTIKEEEPSVSPAEVVEQNIHQNKFVCSYCGQRTKHLSSLKTHIMGKHLNLRPFFCSQCDYRGVTSGQLKTHMMASHTDTRPFQCTHCDYRTVKSNDLKKHVMARHSDTRPYLCIHCDYKTVQAEALKKHVMSKHADTRPFECTYCNYSTVNSCSLKKHVMARHTLTRPFQCTHCDYSAVESRNLDKHVMAWHSETRPFQCSHCDYSTVYSSALKRHVMARHTAIRPFQCVYCDYSSVRPGDLKTHVKGKHM